MFDPAFLTPEDRPSVVEERLHWWPSGTRSA
jgi:hypothetical protein